MEGPGELNGLTFQLDRLQEGLYFVTVAIDDNVVVEKLQITR
jgi:hypothetical protein